jgi:uncharacterized protein (TIGR03437 family)
VPIPLRPPADFLWQRSPFQLTAGNGSGIIESAGIDYLLPYWMGRYYGVISPFSVQSSAAASSAIAPASLASIYGPVPGADVIVSVTDSQGVSRQAVVIYASPQLINFVVPDGTAAGVATLTITGGSTTQVATTTIQNVVPRLFSMNSNGMGVAAAIALQTQRQTPVPVFQCGASGCVSVPIDLNIGGPTFLSLYGTGIRNRSSLTNVKVTINGASVPVLYAGVQPTYAGLDQVNVSLPLTLRGAGESNVVVTVDGQISNAVTINIR